MLKKLVKDAIECDLKVFLLEIYKYERRMIRSERKNSEVIPDVKNKIKDLRKALELEEYLKDVYNERKITIWYNLMVYYFIKQDFKTALYWIEEKILKDGLKSSRKDFINNSKILNLLVHYELEDTDDFESLIKKINYSFKNVDGSKELVDLITELMTIQYKERPLTRKDFVAALDAFYKIDRSKNKSLPYNEIEIWLRSKAEGRSMQKIAESMFCR